MPDYNNGKIYCLTSGNLYYIGSTTNELNTRFAIHKHKHKLWKNNKYHYLSSFRIFDDCDEPEIILYENYSCNNLEELELREGKAIQKYKTDYGDKCVNILLLDKTRDERKEIRKQKAVVRAKKYYLEHTEKCNTKMKENYLENKEARLKSVKEYSLNNKDKISARNKEIVNCECGDKITKPNLRRHIKSKKHLDNLAN